MDVVIVVLDCVREADFPKPTSLGQPAKDFYKEFSHSSHIFPRAIAPGCWTLPSHATILTGLYPWEHNMHGRGSRRLPKFARVVSEDLVSHGYKTQFLSGNPMLDESTDLLRGFQRVRVAKWWEPLVRWQNPHAGIRGTGQGEQHVHRLLSAVSPSLQRIQGIPELAVTFPPLLDVGNRIFYSLTEHVDSEPICSPWIEGEFERFIVDAGSEPIFSFINLFDSHEPYIAPLTLRTSVRNWVRGVTAPQHTLLNMAGRLKPKPEQVRVLHSFYKETISKSLQRVTRMIEILKTEGRWDDTLFIVTSDHGQAFMEDGHLYHGFVVDEAVTRVPLLIHMPTRCHPLSDSQSWVTLADVSALIRTLVYDSDVKDLSGLAQLPFAEKTVYSFSEGIVSPLSARRELSREQYARIDRPTLAAYNGEYKAVVDCQTGQIRTFVVSHVEPGGRLTEAQAGTQTQAASDAGLAASRALTAIHGDGPFSETIDARLKAWGY